MLLRRYRDAMNYKDELNPSIGLAIKYFKYIGVWRHGPSRLKKFFTYSIMIICLCYMINLIINLVLNFHYDIGLWFVQYSAIHFGIFKILVFAKNLKHWESLIIVMADIDMRTAKARNAKLYLPILIKIRGYCTKFVVYYISLAIFINLIFIATYMVNNMIVPYLIDNFEIILLFHAYLPFDESVGLGRNVSTLLQMLYFETSVVYVVGWDVFLLSLMMFLIGHFKALRLRCALAVESREDISLCNIAECHQQYVDLKS